MQEHVNLAGWIQGAPPGRQSGLGGADALGRGQQALFQHGTLWRVCRAFCQRMDDGLRRRIGPAVRASAGIGARIRVAGVKNGKEGTAVQREASADGGDVAAVVLQPLCWLDASRGRCYQGLRLRGQLIGRGDRSLDTQKRGQERPADVRVQRVRRQYCPVAGASNLDIEAARLKQQALGLPTGSGGGNSAAKGCGVAPGWAAASHRS